MVLRPLTRKRPAGRPEPTPIQPVEAATPDDVAAANTPASGAVSHWQDEPEPDGSGERVPVVHRVGAIAVAAVIGVFGILGFADNLEFFSTEGQQVLGMSSNGLLSAISVVTALALLFAASRGPRTASTIMMAIGILFLASALINLALLRTDFNFLAFEMPNVFFSIAAGLVLLTLGAYGRVSGHLPADSPYAHPERDDEVATEEPEVFPETPEERAAEAAMREAEIAVVQRTATPEQKRRVEAMSHVVARQDRRKVWMEFDAKR